MIICVTPDEVKARQPITGGHGTTVHELVGDRSKPWDGPCGHLVTQPALDTVPPHFHEADQYQVFVAGSGRLGGHRVTVGTVHYSDGYSGYGPIVPDPDGCAYMTLRPTFDTSHHGLPADAALARGRKGRQHMTQIAYPPAAPAGVETLFAWQDGVAVHQQLAPAGRSLDDVPAAGGRFWLVMDGGVIIDGKACPQGSCLWVGEGETTPPITAGSKGALMATLCFASAQSRQAREASWR